MLASYIRDSYLGSKCRLILFNIVLSNHPHAHTHTHTCTVQQLDKVGSGWVGVLWLNAFPVMLHRQAAGLLSHCWLCLSLHLCLATVFFHRSPHGCKGHECKCCGEGFEPHSGDEVWARLVLLSPDGFKMGTAEHLGSVEEWGGVELHMKSGR